eukprot:7384775-Prymnesium_polylepis.4
MMLNGPPPYHDTWVCINTVPSWPRAGVSRTVDGFSRKHLTMHNRPHMCQTCDRIFFTGSKGCGPYGVRNTGHPSRRRVFAPIASAP